MLIRGRKHIFAAFWLIDEMKTKRLPVGHKQLGPERASHKNRANLSFWPGDGNGNGDGSLLLRVEIASPSVGANANEPRSRER